MDRKATTTFDTNVDNAAPNIPKRTTKIAHKIKLSVKPDTVTRSRCFVIPKAFNPDRYNEFKIDGKISNIRICRAFTPDKKWLVRINMIICFEKRK